MDGKTNVESGLQFLSRIKVRPILRNLNMTLFPNGLSRNETVEICGNSSSGKTTLLTQLIAKCILPTHQSDRLIGGLGIGVLFINTDHHFMMLKLRNFLVEMLNRLESKDVDQIIIEEVVKQSMSRLKIINCYSGTQFLLTLQTSDDILLKNKEIGLVLIDSIASYYWQDREIGGDWMIDKYIKNLLGIIQKHTFTTKVPLIYTRISYDESDMDKKGTITCVDESKLGNINYRIKLSRSAENKLTCSVQSFKNIIHLNYRIDHNGIVWDSDWDVQ